MSKANFLWSMLPVDHIAGLRNIRPSNMLMVFNLQAAVLKKIMNTEDVFQNIWFKRD